MNVRGPWIEHLMQEEGLSYPQACDYLDGFEFLPFVEDGEHMATLAKKGAEVHFAIYKQHRGKITRRRLRSFFQPILAKEGFLVTKLTQSEPDSFIRRLGFEQIGTSPSHRIYMLNDIALLERKRHAAPT
jgi:hypothetical protein